MNQPQGETHVMQAINVNYNLFYGIITVPQQIYDWAFVSKTVYFEKENKTFPLKY